MSERRIVPAWLTAGLAFVLSGCIAGTDETEAALAEEAIRDGSEDVIRNRWGEQANTLAQWRRDATVGVLGGACTGVLVTPRIVLTAYHCVGALGSTAVYFGPVKPLVAVPTGLREPVAVPVIDVIFHPEAGGGRVETDIALLVLGQRVDHGPTGRRSQVYPAVPVPVGFTQPTGGWQHTDGRIAGFGAIAGDDRGSAVYTDVRQSRLVGIEAVDEIIETHDNSGWGDSGGPLYQVDARGEPVATIGTMAASYTDVDARTQVVRLSNPLIRTWLEGYLNRTRRVGSPARDVWLGGVDVLPQGETGRGFVPDDPDGDGLVGAHDNCPFIRNDDQTDAVAPFGVGDATATCTLSTGAVITYGCDAVDTDGDGIVDPCDNCIDVENGDQRDCDHDGRGDACELDTDSDGVVDDCDNCDEVAAVSQANCNLDAELALGLEPRGDVCDPTPCAQVAVGAVAGGGRVATERIDGFGVGLDLEGEPMGRGTARTGFRWCPCAIERSSDVDWHPTDTAAWRQLCAMRSGCVVDADAYLESSAWTEITQTFESHSAMGDEIVVSYDEPPALAGPRADRFRSWWDLMRDAAGEEHFRSSSFAGVSHGEISAVMWAHSIAWEPPTDDHREIGACGSSTFGCRELGTIATSHYWSGVFASTTGVPRVPDDDVRLPSVASFLEPEMCPFCSTFPLPVLRRGFCEAGKDCWLHVRVAGDDGAADVPLEMRDRSLLAFELASSEWSWARASGGTLVADPDAVRAVALETKDRGFYVRRIVRGTASTLDPSAVPDALRDVPIDGSIALTAPRILLRGDSSTLYVLGSRSGSLARVSVDLRNGVQQARWLTHKSAGALVAATLDPIRPVAYAVERVKKLGVYRLLRIDLGRSGDVIVCGEYPDSYATSQHSMGVTLDGDVVIGAATPEGTHLVQLRWGKEKPEVVGHTTTQMIIDGEIVASAEGLSFVARPFKGGAWTPYGIRHEEMSDASIDDLARLF